MNIDELIFNLLNPSTEAGENHQTMYHAATLIKLMQDRIGHLSDTNTELRDQVERLSLDLGFKNMGMDK